MTGLMPDDPAPMEIGDEGTVTKVNPLSYGPDQIYVDWDNGRTLILLATDPFQIIDNNEEEHPVDGR